MTPLIKRTIKHALTLGIASAALSLSACGGEASQTKTTEAPQSEAAELQIKYVDAQGAYDLLSANSDAVVLDVRTPEEIDGGYIKGAVFANFHDKDFAQQLTKLDRNTPYIVHCKAGGRSTRALTTLKELGFTNVTHMDGGLNGWKHKKLPLVTP